MRRKRLLLVMAVLLCMTGLLSYAENGNVTYSGNSGHFVFAPGSSYSPTDLFPDLKDVMPGDTLTQTIQLENMAKREVKEVIYLRSKGAADDQSAAFLSQLQMTVTVTRAAEKSREIFRAPVSESAALTDWVCLGTLYYGGKAEIEVTLTVPTSLDNSFRECVGKLLWEFRTEELPLGPDDPPITGDRSLRPLWVSLAVLSAAVLAVFVIIKRKNREAQQSPKQATAEGGRANETDENEK